MKVLTVSTKSRPVTNIVLLLSGALLTFIGLSILITPAEFYVGTSVSVSGNTDLFSELSASSTLLLTLGLVSLSALYVKSWRRLVLLLMAWVYLTYGLGRLVAIGLEGSPSITMQWAMIIEWVLALVCWTTWRKQASRD